MTATEALERRIDELCRENEQLRKENQSVGMAAYELGRASLADENAKLRELVRDIYESAYYEYPSYFESKFAGRMRALGIEVNV